MSDAERLNVIIKREMAGQLQELIEALEIKTKKELFDLSLTFLQWAVKKRQEGNIIVALDKQAESYIEFSTPLLDNVKAKS